MARDHVPKRSRWVPPISLLVGVSLSSLITVLLTLAGATLLEENSVVRHEVSRSCVAFQVGSPKMAHTHIHLENVTPSNIVVHLDFVDDGGLNSWANGYDRSLAPWASDDIVFRTPALGTAVKLIAPSASLQATSAIVYDDETPTEIRKAVLCIA